MLKGSHAAIQTRRRLTDEAPVPARSKVERPLCRIRYGFRLIIATCLEQENAGVNILRQSRRDNRAAGPGAADDEVKDIADGIMRKR